MPARSVAAVDNPVTLPPGRARLATIGDEVATANTIGVVDVACFAATTFAIPDVTMTSTFSRTKSAAILAKRSPLPSPHPYSIAIVRPSIHPSSRNRFKKAASRGPSTASVLWPRKPMVGSFVGCCACAATAHPAVAPPSSLMNSRLVGAREQRGGNSLCGEIKLRTVARPQQSCELGSGIMPRICKRGVKAARSGSGHAQAFDQKRCARDIARRAGDCRGYSSSGLPAPRPVDLPFSWEGCYLGVNAGWATQRIDNTLSVTNGAIHSSSPPTFPSSTRAARSACKATASPAACKAAEHSNRQLGLGLRGGRELPPAG